MDLLLRGGWLVDGSGSPGRAADVAVTGDRISAVAPPGSLTAPAGTRVVDLDGLVLGNSAYCGLMCCDTSPHSASGRSPSSLIDRSAEQLRRCGPNASKVSTPPYAYFASVRRCKKLKW